MSIIAPVSIPSAIAYRTAPGRPTPLSNIELDQNFAFLHNEADLRLKIEDFTSTNIITKLNSDAQSASPGGIDSYLLRGLPPQTDNIPTTLVARDGNGNFSANVITATTFAGNATTSTTASEAIKLQTSRQINGVNFDGSEDITVYDSKAFLQTGGFLLGRIKLAEVVTSTQDGVEKNITKVERGSDGVVTITTDEVHNFAVGQYVTVTVNEEVSVNIENAPIVFVSPYTFKYDTGNYNVIAEVSDTGTCRTESLAPLNIPLTSQTLSLPADGDIWLTIDGQYNRINGADRKVAYVDSDISGTSANVTGVVAVDHGGTGADNSQDARENLEAAKSGINEDITGLRGLTEPVPYNAGGTGLTSPGPEGNVLISDGTAWLSAQPHYPVSGMITYFAGENAPTGWLPCFGQLLLKTEYPNLYNAIGLRYTETILQIYSIDFGDPGAGVQAGFGTERVPSGTGLGETGGFDTAVVGGGSYLRFGTYTNTIHGVAFVVRTAQITNSVATLTFSALAEPPFQVGGRILVNIPSQSLYYNGAWEVLSCNNTSVTFYVPSYARTLVGSPTSNIGTVQRSRFAKLTINALYANRMSFDVIRGNDSNGGERPNSSTDSLRLYYKDIATGFLNYIGNLYPASGDPEATFEEASDQYAATWKTRALTIPFRARNDNQTFEIHQSSVGAEFNSVVVTSSATVIEEEDAASGFLRIKGTFPQINTGDYLIFSGFGGAELWKVNGTWIVTSKTTNAGVDTLVFNVAIQAPIGSVAIPTTNLALPLVTGTVRFYTGYPGLADAYGVKRAYFYDVQSEDSESFSFRLPDLRGLFVRGWDADRGIDIDRPLGSVQDDAIGPHRHNLVGDFGTPFFAVSTGYGGIGEYGTVGSNVRAGSNGVMSTVTGYVDGSFDRETRPVNIALLPCIKI